MEKTKSLRTIKWVLPLLVAVFGVGVVFAVSGKHAPQPVVTPQWFVYDGINPQLEAASYDPAAVEPGCSGETALCAIRLDISGGTNSSALDDADVQAFIDAKDTDNDDDLDAVDYDEFDEDMKYRN